MTPTPFGTLVDGYTVPVFNERAVRAAAGLQFLWVFTGMLLVLTTGEIRPLRAFALAFGFDMIIRLFIDARYSPFLLLGGLAVRGQTPEWVGAPQKRVAWGLGLALSLTTCFAFGRLGLDLPYVLGLCGICVSVLFLETAFGICVGCALHKRFARTPTQYCPGDTCARP